MAGLGAISCDCRFPLIIIPGTFTGERYVQLSSEYLLLWAESHLSPCATHCSLEVLIFKEALQEELMASASSNQHLHLITCVVDCAKYYRHTADALPAEHVRVVMY